MSTPAQNRRTPDKSLPVVTAVALPVHTQVYGVVAAAGTGKTTASQRYGWYDTDQLELQRPELSTTNFPTWWNYLYALVKAMPSGAILTFLTGADAFGSGVATTNLITVMPDWDLHLRRCKDRNFDAATIKRIQTERALLTLWSKRFNVPVLRTFDAVSAAIGKRGVDVTSSAKTSH